MKPVDHAHPGLVQAQKDGPKVGLKELDCEPVFSEPWQARAFALAVHLHDRGLFTWTEWSRALGEVLKTEDGPLSSSQYYRCWLTALERLAIAKAGVSAAKFAARAREWRKAAADTPHGQPIRLKGRIG